MMIKMNEVGWLSLRLRIGQEDDHGEREDAPNLLLFPGEGRVALSCGHFLMSSNGVRSKKAVFRNDQVLEGRKSGWIEEGFL